MAPFRFSHETLHAYGLMVEVAQWLAAAKWPVGRAHLRDQGLRAAESAVLNIAEARMNSPRARANHYRIALNSAAEACAVLDLVPLADGSAAQEKLRRVGLMLTRLR